ncbi:hypothetical protein B0O99DRAFT_618037 [Bisporella sp. PMI_857]|nr:hypothetical protein B0O99DRAFT_618037 [Bisporella sp. PMI_857]
MPCLVHPSNRWVTMENQGLWINYEWDVVMVRGYWNIIAIEDMCTRLGGRIRSLAVDVTGNFLEDLLSCDAIKGGKWPLPGLEEVLLYDGKGEDALKHSYIGGNAARRELEFVDVVVEGEIVDGETRQRLEERRLKFEGIFDGLENAVREGLEREDCERKENGNRGGSTFGIDPRPNIKIMKLLIRPVAAETTN